MSRRGIPAMILLAVLPFGGKAHRETERGNRLYAEGEYEASLQAYTEAGVAAPDSPEIQYNIGNVLYRQEDFTGAAEQFARAVAASPPELRPSASYNLGNALYHEGDYQGAAGAFRRALEADPTDRDAKRNLEIALRALQRQQQQSQGSQGESDQDESAEDSEQQPQEGGSSSPEAGEQRRNPPPGEEPSPGEPREMSAEEAKRLLDRLDEEEKEGLRRELRQAFAGEETQREKDW